MTPSLQLRTSQHLTLTPQLQQSIRLLQLSTLELSAEIEQMLDDNPFLERNAEEAPREEFGLDRIDAPLQEADREAEHENFERAPEYVAEQAGSTSASDAKDAEPEPLGASDEPDWDGDGGSDIAPDDGEWGGEAPAHRNNLDGDGLADATELSSSQLSLQDHLHRQALSMRLGAEDSAALRFLIESLNDDGYLEDSFESLAEGLAGGGEARKQEKPRRAGAPLHGGARAAAAPRPGRGRARVRWASA